VERFALRNYLIRFLCGRNQLIKEVAESEMWRKYLSKTGLR
jgi:hypothetical protein